MWAQTSSWSSAASGETRATRISSIAEAKQAWRHHGTGRPASARVRARTAYSTATASTGRTCSGSNAPSTWATGISTHSG
jgi:hypothetical protein